MPMRQLRSCDFCGEDASGIYEVLPAELSPTEEEQRRVVLCEDCLGTLETAVDPLLARLRDGAASGNAAVERRGESPEPVSPSEMSSQRENSVDRRPIATSAKNTTDVTPMTTGDGTETDAGEERGVGATNGGAETAGDDLSATEEETSDEETFGDRPAEDYEVDEEEATGEETAAAESVDSAGGRDGAAEATEEEETSDEETFGDRPAEDYEVDGADRKQSVDGDPAEDYEVEEDTDATPVSEEVANDAESVGSEPQQFRKVMRLLNNREFPVNRAEFADLASGAYEIDRSEVSTIIDYAVRRDVLEEEDGQLRKA